MPGAIPFWFQRKRLDVSDPFPALIALVQQQTGASAPPGGAPVPTPPPEPAPPAAVSLPVPAWFLALVDKYTPPDLKGDRDWFATVSCGAEAESNYIPDRMQPNGCGVGLFQFDTCGGMGTGVPMAQLVDPDYQAARIIPKYATYYRAARSYSDPAEQASWVAAQAERPYRWDSFDSVARRNYAAAYRRIMR